MNQIIDVIKAILGIISLFIFAGTIIFFVHTAVKEVKRKKYGGYITPEEEERMLQEEKRMLQEEERLQREEEKLWLEKEKLWLQVEEKVKKELSSRYYLKTKIDPKLEEEFLNLCRRNPDRNIPYNTTESLKVHVERLGRFRRSMFVNQMYYLGDRGAIYTLTKNGNRQYKY